jgi:hypothetical protein
MSYLLLISLTAPAHRILLDILITKIVPYSNMLHVSPLTLQNGFHLLGIISKEQFNLTQTFFEHRMRVDLTLYNTTKTEHLTPLNMTCTGHVNVCNYVLYLHFSSPVYMRTHLCLSKLWQHLFSKSKITSL